MIQLDRSVHDFTHSICDVLEKHFGEYSEEIFSKSTLIQYLNEKTVSANRGSKARGSFANLYALYVVIEDYIGKGFFGGSCDTPYTEYEGARFSDLLRRVRELPFGRKLQNHALNSRLNEEYQKFFPTSERRPIVRSHQSKRYWIQEDLLLIPLRLMNGKQETFNIAQAVIDVIEKYVSTKRNAFDKFIETCKQIAKLDERSSNEAKKFIKEQLSPDVDARIFEIVSYSVLKEKYGLESVWIGPMKDDVSEEFLGLYRTGRSNANDGGIDFVMKPLGRFFQVTETIDVNKYFLDIDKVQKYPITFVVKSDASTESILHHIENQARQKYRIESVVRSFMEAIEQIINSGDLVQAFDQVVEAGRLANVMNEIVTQSKIEFNYE